MLVIFGEGWKRIKVSVTFLVVDSPTSYNAILGRTTINPNKIVASTVHQKMKFPTPNGIGEVLGDHPSSRQCYVNCLGRKNQREALAIETEADPREDLARPEPMEELEEVEVDGPDKKVRIGTTLKEDQKEAMTALLRKFKELFAWQPSDMPGISTNIISHELRIDPSIKPIAQKRRSFGTDKRLTGGW